ncbi:MAG: MBL fold metallo-hydrolase [Hungatella sp.]|nr:MBL fold metallo-hydrolase [Hungatella sp.]
MLKFTFLGINGSLQEPEAGNTSLVIAGEEGSVAVDLSVNLWVAAAADIDGVILTHEHIDHVYGLPSLCHQLWIGGRERPLVIHLPSGMKELAEGLIDLFGIRAKSRMFDIRFLTEPKFRVGTMSFTLFPTDHTGHSVGLAAEEKGEKLVYTSDTRPITEIPDVMRGAGVLIHEASGVFREEEILIEKGHSSGADAGTLARELKVRKLYLCHLPVGKEAKREILCEARGVFEESDIPEILKENRVQEGA